MFRFGTPQIPGRRISLTGSLICGNRKGIAVADIATQNDLDELSSFGDVVVLESGVNAAGNLIECNDRGP